MQNLLAKFFPSQKKKELDALRQARRERIAEEKPQALRTRLNNPYFQKEKIPDSKNEIWVYLGIVALVLGLLSYLTFGTGYFTFKNIKIEGLKNISEEQLRQLVQNSLKQKILWFIPADNFLIFKPTMAEAAIYDGLANQFVLADLEVTKEFPDTLLVKIKERIPGLTWVTQEQYYYLDPEGVITQKIDNPAAVDPNYPKIYDQNNLPIGLDQQVISEELVDFIMQIEDNFSSQSHLAIDSYNIPQIQCQEKKHVMETVFAEEIAAAENLEIKNKKKAIQEKYKSGEINVDESLALLEQINSKDDPEEDQQNSTEKKVIWDVVYQPIDCDFVKINSEINLKTKSGFEVYLDSKLDLDIQLDNLNSVLNEKISDQTKINYIDLRFLDRVYYK